MKHLFVCIIGFILILPSFAQNLKKKSNQTCRCLPTQPCWPNKDAWHSLEKKLSGRLVQPTLPLANCKKNIKSKECETTLQSVKNPFFLQKTPGAQESQGWYKAWNNQASTYAVEAKTTNDVVAAVNFARKYNLRLVIKGAGHDYLGRSNAPNSLLIWTHNMRKIDYHASFIPERCSQPKGVPAITVQAGTRWLEAYTEATTKLHQYVQGGGCTTVGAAGGFTQGGGFGSFSKQFGTGAAGVLQAEVVTADGKILIANQCQNKDLFWAIRGGGGGTYGVVTKMTLRLHPLPQYFGVLRGTIKAKDNAAFKTLIKHFLIFFRDQLNNPQWGEQFAFHPNNTISIFMLTQGLNEKQALKIWQPLKDWINTSKTKYIFTSNYISIPPEKMWDLTFWEKEHPDLVIPNTQKNARPGEYWWAPNKVEVFNQWYTYQSWWLPLTLLKKSNLDNTVSVFYKASRLAPVSLHINKGLAGSATDALLRSRQTSTNPSVYRAAALVIMSAGSNKVKFTQDKDSILNINKKVKKINQAMQLIQNLALQEGTYANEADYFQKNWQDAFWGTNYARLLKIKQFYDPKGLFYCHHCVGSEAWTKNGMCKS